MSVTCPCFYLFPSETIMEDLADPRVGVHSLNKIRMIAGDLPWGNGSEVVEHHLVPPTPLCHGNPLNKMVIR